MVEFRSDGRSVLAERLRQAPQTCAECGFEDAIVDGAWRTRAGQSRSSRVAYLLRCPDCGTTREVPLTL